MRFLVVPLMAACAAGLATDALGQTAPARWEVGGQVASAFSSQFDTADPGFGGRVAWRPMPLLGLEAELNLYPSQFANDQLPFSRSRVEGVFGVTAGVAWGRLRPFARLRPGFVNLRPAARAFACILIFPPPLACELASGDTLFALDVGGGVKVGLTSRTFVRFDAGDRALRYPGPVFDTDRKVHQEPFFSHDFRFAAGAGVKF